jgi:hypothetical protein
MFVRAKIFVLNVKFVTKICIFSTESSCMCLETLIMGNITNVNSQRVSLLIGPHLDMNVTPVCGLSLD